MEELRNSEWFGAWDEEGRFYTPQEGLTVNFGEENYATQIVEIDLGVNEGDFPTSKRVITEVAVDLEADHDVIVCVFPGWGETTAQFDKDFLEIQLKVLRDKGYLNPKVIGVNCSGKGTEDYMKNKGKIVNIGFQSEIDDARMMARRLTDLSKLDAPIYFVGHSMGYLTSTAFAEEIARMARVNDVIGEQRRKIAGMMQLMPSTDDPFGHVDWAFVSAVMSKVPVALKQFVGGRVLGLEMGGITLSPEDVARIMFSSDASDALTDDYWRRGVDDSATKFLGVAFNPKERFDLTFLRGLPYGIACGVKDQLIPLFMTLSARNKVAAIGAKVGFAPMNMAHSFPREIVGDLRSSLEWFFVEHIQDAS